MNVTGAFLTRLGREPLSNAPESRSPVRVYFARLVEDRCTVLEPTLPG
jgi:hypothetical protein